MSFENFDNLLGFSGSGQSLICHPTRIKPFDDYSDQNNNKLTYETPVCSEGVIILDSDIRLPKPAAYLSGPHSFVRSLLYLTSIEFYESCHLPIRSDSILKEFLMEKLITESDSKEKKKGNNKKLIQLLLSKGCSCFDTDPSKNPYFSNLYDNILGKNEEILLIRSNDLGYFSETLPRKLPKFTSDFNKKDKTYFVILEFPNRRFSPYGKTYSLLKA